MGRPAVGSRDVEDADLLFWKQMLLGSISFEFRKNRPLFLGCIVLAFAFLCAVALLGPLYGRMERINEDMGDLRAHPANASRSAAMPLTLSDQLAEFYRRFPSRMTVPENLEELQEIAARDGLSLEQGDYTLTRDKDGPLFRYVLSFPLHGSYLDLRRFLAEALGKLPHMALTSLTLHRQRASDSQLDAEFKFTLYLSD